MAINDDNLKVSDIRMVKAALTAAETIYSFVVDLIKGNPKFTGKLEINFKDGVVMDINETQRHKFDNSIEKLH